MVVVAMKMMDLRMLTGFLPGDHLVHGPSKELRAGIIKHIVKYGLFMFIHLPEKEFHGPRTVPHQREGDNEMQG